MNSLPANLYVMLTFTWLPNTNACCLYVAFYADFGCASLEGVPSVVLGQ